MTVYRIPAHRVGGLTPGIHDFAVNVGGVRMRADHRRQATVVTTSGDDACRTVDLEWTPVAGRAGERPHRILLPGLVALLMRDQPTPLEAMSRPSEEDQPFRIGATRW